MIQLPEWVSILLLVLAWGGFLYLMIREAMRGGRK